MERKRCKFDGCIYGVDYSATNYCRTHHKKFMSGQELKPIKRRGSGRSICYVEHCDRFVDRNGLCESHHLQLNKGLPFTLVKKIAKPGSGCINPRGYRQITVNGERWFEHRYVMSQYLSRELLPSESVHHMNGNRSDNRIENLELWSDHQPSGQRVIDKIKWAQEILVQYHDEIPLLLTMSDGNRNN